MSRMTVTERISLSFLKSHACNPTSRNYFGDRINYSPFADGLKIINLEEIEDFLNRLKRENICCQNANVFVGKTTEEFSEL